ncbi:MAG: type II toxin-antitoxin system YafQ family toxin [Spirochaetaceae bacterium]
MYRILYTEHYNKRARKFLKRHPEVKQQYRKSLELLEVDPGHPSLRLHKLKGSLSELYSVSINISYRITLFFIIEKDAIVPVDIGSHEEVYE